MLDWDQVFDRLEELENVPQLWRAGQDASLQWLRDNLSRQPGVLIADEVGLGKTRLAIALAVCVAHCGGRVAIVIPPGLTFQWRDEELAGFLRQAVEHGASWLENWWPGGGVLRTFRDLFTIGKAFPVAAHAPITFISHTFGLPRTKTARHPELWALPFMLKKELVDGRQVKGAGQLVISDYQADAVKWLVKNGSPSSLKSVRTGPLGKPSPAAFSNSANQELFEDLVGQLVGQFDLILIDEAHKGRAGDDATKTEKAAETTRKSRLSRLLNHILLRPEAKRTRAAKRVALTATPMEMDASQWVTIFNRIGLDDERVGGLKDVVTAFEKAARGLHVGSDTELAALRSAACEFNAKLKPLVTRRLWRDDATVQRFAQATGAAHAAHPHRQLLPGVKRLADMSSRDRTYLALTEALSAAARGADTAFEVKTTGSRFAQALPLLPESPETAAANPGDGAKGMRVAYWRERIHDLDRDHADLAADRRWSLQWHPRVRHAICLVEKLAKNGKVLVFGEFIESLRALERALNIRHYLRHVSEGQALPLPRGVDPDDADLRRWLTEPEFGFDAKDLPAFARRAADLAARYESDRSHLRDLCKEAILIHCRNDPLSPASEKTLTTWLVQQLCVENKLWAVGDADGKATVLAQATGLLCSVRDPDPPDEAQDDPGIAAAMRWPKIIEQLEADLQKDANDFVFRMSPFAQLLIGDTKPATRRARQGTFNNPQLNPRVLIGQSDVMSEGLNLHRACRTLVLFHLDWNPGRIEQQIGRVDRQDSDWMAACDTALNAGEKPPTLDVYTVAVEGTYDDLRMKVVTERAQVLRAQLFGEIVPANQLASLGAQAQHAIGQIDIDFRPPLRRAVAAGIAGTNTSPKQAA
ncbi:helicase-related protein [Acidovorax sp. Be4]|uniref:Helicase-related protein n=1 Tax=Acidovorax bellezanensis TaxID=2976702 RepID=A0ABT2PKD5_9BURK|nr:helicase-related protein [Acidovorax sp. Be4]MCT9810927.1 helicase-related protein [Acidovorax sp. Be4]